MKLASWIAALLGLALLLVIVVHHGVGDVVTSLARAGWWLVLVLPLHALPLVLDARAWQVLLRIHPGQRAASLPFLVWIATVREAVNRLLPTVSIGGEIVGIRLARLRLPDTIAVTASIVVEVMLTVIAQYVFAAVGIVLILFTVPQVSEVWAIGAALCLSLPVPFALTWLLKSGAVFTRLHALAARLLGEANRFVARMEGARLDGAIDAAFRDPRALVVAGFWQLAGLVAGALETWCLVAVLGHPVSVAAAIGIEALAQAVRNLVFVVPGGIGVQEGAVILFARLVGVDADTALSLALLKRAREIVYGVPALLSWQWTEARLVRGAVLARRGAVRESPAK